MIPLLEAAGNVGGVLPWQTMVEVPKEKVGVTIGFTVTVNVTDVAHTPAVGVKVYTPEFILSMVAGLHVPLIPLLDVVGSVGTDPPSQIVSPLPTLKVGIVFGLTVTVTVVPTAHCPAVGVNVYVPEF